MPPKLGILAGGGELPSLIVRACRESGRDFFVIALEGQAEAGAFADVPHVRVRLENAGAAVERLRAEGCEELVMAGNVRRPSFSALRPDLWSVRFLARSGAQGLGDGGLLKTLTRTLEEDEGFRVVGIDALMPDLLATEGAFGALEPDDQAGEDIDQGIDAALEIGRQDIAQGAVVQMGQVLAQEDEDGTDALLKQARKLRLDGPGGVLVKVKKPGQEHRVDLPTIGVATVEAASQAGLRGIAVEAGGALVIDRRAVVEAADAAGLFVIGVDVASRAEALAKKRAGASEAEKAAGPLVFLVAGEPSGDLLGARLMAQLRQKTSGAISFAGIGGTRMEEQGLKSLFPMDELSVMGATEVVPRLPRIVTRLFETVQAVENARPAVLVTIDSPDFSFRVAKRLKGKGIPLVHYVAPTVWAWRPGRARKIARFLDHLMTLLPFEPPYFETEGLPATFVGHPVVESGADKGDRRGFRKRLGIAAGDKVVTVLLGSRASEVRQLHEAFGQALFLLMKKHPDLQAVVPVADAVAGSVRQATAGWAVPTTVVEGERDKYDAFHAADVALAASGTVALELAMARTPAVIAYRINRVSGWIAKRVITVRFVHLVNLILDRAAIPEFLQEACRPDFLAAALEDLLMDKGRRKKQVAAYDEALRQLDVDGPTPASRAADVVLEAITQATRGD